MITQLICTCEKNLSHTNATKMRYEKKKEQGKEEVSDSKSENEQ